MAATGLFGLSLGGTEGTIGPRRRECSEFCLLRPGVEGIGDGMAASGETKKTAAETWLAGVRRWRVYMGSVVEMLSDGCQQLVRPPRELWAWPSAWLSQIEIIDVSLAACSRHTTFST